ncbi:hypothetical protein [Paludibaculum fermentans]|uniref:hypothetical protein n=1 Tax=Paludibaculum fermentans TaxID=1473598 RepID=UPI003EC03A77
MRISAVAACFAALLGSASQLSAATVYLVSLEGFLHYQGSSTPQASFTTSSPEFTSFLDSSSLGSFQFTWTNATASTIHNLTFTLFIDPDLDRDDNTFFNEYGEFVSSLLPALSPPGALGFSQWEIDEPEYVFGDIYTHANAGALDSLNAIPSSSPDDVSHALLFEIAQLDPGHTLTVTGMLSLTDAAGLGHFDPDSHAALYANGYALTNGPPSGVPEPSSAIYLTLGATLLVVLRRYKS